MTINFDDLYRAMVEAGFSKTMIAETMNCSEKTIEKWAKAFGIYHADHLPTATSKLKKIS